ncbi:hypothetical protein JST97_29765 [bacterium]|nr:hypothetical protein [bacterium]
MRTEELMTRVRAAAGGAEPMTEMAPLIESVELGTQQILRQFLADAESDVEMASATREQISNALTQYLSALGRMREAALSQDPRLLSQSVDGAEACVNLVRSAQDAHQAQVAQGATVFPYLNRVLFHYGLARSGGARTRLLELLREAPSFIHWLRFELEGREVSPVTAQQVFHLQQLLEAVTATAAVGGALPDIQPEVVALAPQLAVMLEGPLRPGAAKGPTPIPAVNRVFKALETCTGAEDEVEFLLSVLGQCRTSLRTVVPPGGLLEPMRRLNFVLNSLDKMERCLRERTAFEELVAAAGQLEASSKTLAQVVAASAPPPAPQTIPPNPQTQGLPVIFASVLDAGYAFVNGSCDANTLRAAAQHLDAAASKMQKETARVSQSDSRLDSIQQGLELMRETAETLRGLAGSGNANLLEFARVQSRQAVEHLEVAGVIKGNF